jgi:galactose mutarotase-like enzyme
LEAIEKISLENDLLRVELLPSIGGKIVSLRSIRTGEEFFLPPINVYQPVSSSDEFSESDGGGFDECLPSVASCESIEELPPIADHGDLWRQRWLVDSQDGAAILHADATSRPLRLTRKASLKDAGLILDYEVVNLSDEATTWLWSAHPLLRVQGGDVIVLPDEIKKLAVAYSATSLFEKDKVIDWPIAKSASGVPVDLSRIRDRDGVTAYKLFARMENSGWAALYRKQIRQGIVFSFDTTTIPFLGLWISLGTWPDGRDERQYTVALEPTTSDSDSLANAIRNGSACTLNARERSHWKIEIRLVGATSPISFEEFCDFFR